MVLLGGLAGPALEVVLAFGLAALSCLVTQELLVEAREVLESPLTTIIFFVWFPILVLLGLTAQPPLGWGNAAGRLRLALLTATES